MKPRVRAATSAAVAESKRGGNSGPGSLHISSNSGRLPFTRDCTRANPVSVETMTALAASPSTDPAIGRPVRVPIPVEFGRTPIIGAGDQCSPWGGQQREVAGRESQAEKGRVACGLNPNGCRTPTNDFALKVMMRRPTGNPLDPAAAV
jgi:hypothetical protein